MKKNNRSWFMVTLSTVLIAGAVAFSATRGRASTPATSSYAGSVAQLRMPALDRMVSRLAAEARTDGK